VAAAGVVAAEVVEIDIHGGILDRARRAVIREKGSQ
jgi:hypothetical protein